MRRIYPYLFSLLVIASLLIVESGVRHHDGHMLQALVECMQQDTGHANADLELVCLGRGPV